MGNSISIAILAGGLSSRFGAADKQELPFLGIMLGRRVAEQALAAGHPVTVIGRNRKPYEGLPIAFGADLIPGYGPLSGLHAALSLCGTDYVYLLACDMPGFSNPWFDHLRCMADSGIGPDAILALVNRKPEPFHALYSRRLASVLEARFSESAASGMRLSFARALEGRACRYVPESLSSGLTDAGRIFRGINTPLEAERLERELQPQRH